MVSVDFLKTIIDNWDPIQLLSAGAPLDEYAPEINKILKIVNGRSNKNESEIARTIYSVFLSAFGRDVFLSDMEECLTIARKICSKSKGDCN